MNSNQEGPININSNKNKINKRSVKKKKIKKKKSNISTNDRVIPFNTYQGSETKASSEISKKDKTENNPIPKTDDKIKRNIKILIAVLSIVIIGVILLSIYIPKTKGNKDSPKDEKKEQLENGNDETIKMEKTKKMKGVKKMKKKKY